MAGPDFPGSGFSGAILPFCPVCSTSDGGAFASPGGEMEKGGPPPAPSRSAIPEDAASALAISRSTSAGSYTPRSSCFDEAALEAADGLPSLRPAIASSAVPFVVRNTFINEVLELDPLLEGFFQERRVKSCPSSPMRFRAQESSELEVCQDVGEDEPEHVASPMPPLLAPRVLRLADTLQDPFLGSVEMPSLGSRGHAQGMCKPCAFVHTKGCGNGLNCEFCHICDSGARKRRQKERLGRWKDTGCDAPAWRSSHGGA
eukprot:CAMPEP_0115138014 /NCGR_PEP_ID=MMETSP0227-20121206/57404_1 /TAXON_ID=89957 /ORGANISM="Polarella glacialis, Strain CCMP 1383" /LENGTH=258 /DNA_ID=CAMNT_0002545533 /DNA_START=1 /DNA_END=778 /DNA_ORIENTATION=+